MAISSKIRSQTRSGDYHATRNSCYHFGFAIWPKKPQVRFALACGDSKARRLRIERRADNRKAGRKFTGELEMKRRHTAEVAARRLVAFAGNASLASRSCRRWYTSEN